MSDLATIKAGDKVLRRCSHNWGSTQYKVFTVESITPKGFIKCAGELWTAEGRQRSDKYGSYRIIPFDQALLDEQKGRIEHGNRARALGATDWDKADASLVEKIYTLLNQKSV